MNKKCLFLFVGASILLTSCGVDSEADIANDVEAQQFNQERLGPQPPSIRGQNRERMAQDERHTAYAHAAGFYLAETATLLEDMTVLFEQNQVNQENLSATQDKLDEIRQKSEQFINLDRPATFDGFHHVHLATLVELDALRRILDDMQEPIHPLQVTNARVYYENAVMSHKLMEREFMSVTEELGIY
ncbi:hypothetical protein [Halalkalibacter alkalisediminis]|uniref:DUF4142 domain-containing protein n=1 Tax=Halalkalibacter alkalisediminis TaxID=935616 RepID=A0ABV6NGW7_9BACI|nr:hypothetical protein [Halalkalibacter alkalisediminis]